MSLTKSVWCLSEASARVAQTYVDTDSSGTTGRLVVTSELVSAMARAELTPSLL